MSPPNVVVAAAGSGKTTLLVREYLRHLAAGIPAEKIVAITFTRMAGAELVDRVSLALRAGLGDAHAQAELGPVFESEYRPVLPTNPDEAKRALRALAAAPVGTTDSFAQTLLAEFALDAFLPLSEGAVPLDIAGAAGGPAKDAFTAAARAVVDPADRNVPVEATRCLAHMTLETLLLQIAGLASKPPLASLDTSAVQVEARAIVGRVVRKVLAADPTFRGNSGENEAQEIAAKQWLELGAPGEAPAAGLAYVAYRLSAKAKDADALKAACEGEYFDFGVAAVPAAGVLRQFTETTQKSFATAGQIRADLTSLAQKSRDAALRLIANSGALDYDHLAEAAIYLCENPPERLRRRFGAILVDEAQDANPTQMRLYDALSRLPGNNTRLPTLYVGDPRQSIYLFRGAEPQVFEACVDAATQGNTLGTLDHNRRSSPQLVKAQKALFAAAALGTPDQPGLAGVRSIAAVQEEPNNERHALSGGLTYPEPVVMVWEDASENPDELPVWKLADADDAAVECFAERITNTWSTETGHGGDDAAVLCSSWARALSARNRLRVILGADRAFLLGSRELLTTRTAADVRILVRALWSSADRIAWAALYKLPMIGLSDAALAALSAGAGLLWRQPKPDGDNDGVVAPNFGGLAGPIYGARLDPLVYSASDVAAFAEARPVLEAALQRIGRLPTADVVETVAATLGLRAVLLAGPEGEDAVAQLEVLLDWMRAVEQDGVDPDAIIDMLDPESGEAEIPRIQLSRAAQSVVCTTVFQAKGLKWDHVCVVGLGSGGGGVDADAWTRQDATWEGTPCSVIGVRFDPALALAPRSDLHYRIADNISAIRADEERLRVTYVAITRAVRSVTFGLVPDSGSRGIHSKLAALWNDDTLAGVRHIRVRKAPTRDSAPQVHAVAARDFAIRPTVTTGWRLVSPSKDADSISNESATELVKAVAARAKIQGETNQKIEMPVSVNDMDDRLRGDLLHGWMAVGGMTGSVCVADASAYLAKWPAEYQTQEVADYLLRVSTELRLRLPEVQTWLSRDDCERVFEAPLVGVVDEDRLDKRLYSGSMDLLLVESDGRLWVIDFKGQSAPGSLDQLASVGTFRKNVLQVEAYRKGLERAGYTVAGCGLLFLGKMTWVGW